MNTVGLLYFVVYTNVLIENVFLGVVCLAHDLFSTKGSNSLVRSV